MLCHNCVPVDRLSNTLGTISFVSIAGTHFGRNLIYSRPHQENIAFSALRMYGISHELWPSLVVVALWIGKLSITIVGCFQRIQSMY